MTLAELLDEAGPRLIAGVEAAVSPTAADLASRRAIERLPGLLQGLLEQLRADKVGDERPRAQFQIQFDVAPLVAALRLLRAAIYALIDDRRLPATPREMRIMSEWFSTVAESALTAENRRFADLLDAVPDHMLLQDADGRLIYVNRATAEPAKLSTGLSRDELLGQRLIDFHPDKKFGQHIDELLKRVRNGDSVTEEFILPSPEGGRWHQHHLRPIFGPDGKVEAIATSSRDIDDRKRSEARSQLLSKLSTVAETMEYEGVLDAVSHISLPELADWCIMETVEDGQLTRAMVAHRDPDKADLAKELLRFPAQLQRLPFAEEVLAGHSLLVTDLTQTFERLDPEVARIVRQLGAHSALLVPFNVLSKPVALAIFIRDSGRRYVPEDLVLAEEMARRAAQMIENARLHQQLRQSEARFRLALDQANIAVFETDLELKMRWGYNSQFGVSDAQFIGKTVSEILGDTGIELDQLKRRVLSTGESASKDFSAVLGDRRRHFMVRYEALRGVGGIVGLTGATIDVTELKEAEEQLARELGFRERMMGVLGHDLRNPVSAVLGMAGLMRLDASLNDKTREGLGLIEQSARRMNEMIGTLLDFTRLRFHGSLPVTIEEIDLGELSRGVVAELQAAHRGRELTLSASGNLRGQWDPARMAQVISNLASNALSHGARESAVQVVLTEEREAVVLSVSNRGPTIPAALIERLFEPFQQGAEGGGGPRGLGLGLFIVREIVRAHGGAIDVRSDEGLTTFSVRLPR
jgi:PAS domain S-box-containing protein